MDACLITAPGPTRCWISTADVEVSPPSIVEAFFLYIREVGRLKILSFSVF